MGLIKRKRRNAAGKLTQDANWTVDFADHAGIRRRVPGFTNRNASAELERTIRHLVSLRQSGGAPDAALNRQLEAMPSVARDKLAKWGVIEAARAAAGKSLDEHIADWVCHLAAKESADRHCRQSKARLTRMIVETHMVYWSDIAAERVESWLADKREKGMSNRTSNSYLASAKAFCAWMVKTGLAQLNPLTRLSKLNEKTDKRHERRAFIKEEICKLLAAAERGPRLHGLSGPVRVLLYRLALETGLRFSEIRSLTRGSFNFSGNPASVFLAAKDAKNGQDATLILRPSLANDLAIFLRLHAPAARAFNMTDGKGAAMMRADLEAAGIPYVDEYGRYGDFHALRHTFISSLAESGVHPKVAQELARHSSIDLTMGHYTHTLLETRMEAINPYYS